MIALDQDGHVAAGTSTNGLTHKVPGYVDYVDVSLKNKQKISFSNLVIRVRKFILGLWVSVCVTGFPFNCISCFCMLFSVFCDFFLISINMGTIL